MSNYPPGMSKRDFIRAGIDEPHYHEHEWVCEGDIIFEDGCAHFEMVCDYVEGRWGEGFSCEETEYVTLEPKEVVRYMDRDKITIPKENFEKVQNLVDEALELVEMGHDFKIEKVVPPESVTVTAGNYKVTYE